MEKLSLSKAVCIVFAFCAATAIASPAQTFTTLASFNGTNGENPASSLIQATDGNFYGTTRFGGSIGWGTVFKMSPSGALTTVHSFNSSDGGDPLGGWCKARMGTSMGRLRWAGPTNV